MQLHLYLACQNKNQIFVQQNYRTSRLFEVNVRCSGIYWCNLTTIDYFHSFLAMTSISTKGVSDKITLQPQIKPHHPFSPAYHHTSLPFFRYYWSDHILIFSETLLNYLTGVCNQALLTLILVVTFCLLMCSCRARISKSLMVTNNKKRAGTSILKWIHTQRERGRSIRVQKYSMKIWWILVGRLN